MVPKSSKRAFRNVILKLHLWAGLLVGMVMVVAGFSGTLLVFESQIDDALNAKIAWVQPKGRLLSLTQASGALERAKPGYKVREFLSTESAKHSCRALLVQPASGDGLDVAFNQYTGDILGEWDTRFSRVLNDLHTSLLAGRIGSEIVGWSTLLLFLLGISGIYLWWPRKRFAFDWKSSGTKFQFDLHNAVGILSSIVLLCFAFTGIVMHWRTTADKFASLMSGTQSWPDVPTIAGDNGQLPMDPDSLLNLARTSVPGAIPTTLKLSRSAEDGPSLVILRYPEDRTPSGRTWVYVDPFARKVLASTDSRKVPVPIQFVTRVNHELHTGDIYGWPTKIVACLCSLMLPVLALSGAMLWWYRRSARNKVQVKGATAET